jgi:predicted AlkP superfamily pyrophosphatase or phosphodiesterase
LLSTSVNDNVAHATNGSSRITVQRMTSGHVLTASIVAVVLGACSQPSEPEPERLAVLLIVVDTLRADRLGFYGCPRATSPLLDDWATRGAVFERSYATSPWTLPSFGSLFTGHLPSRHGAGTTVPRHDEASARPVGHISLFGERRSFAGLDPSLRPWPKC